MADVLRCNVYDTSNINCCNVFILCPLGWVATGGLLSFTNVLLKPVETQLETAKMQILYQI